MMRPPEDYFPAEQVIPMDERGRPLHTLFYTVTPQFYELMQKVGASEEIAFLTGHLPCRSTCGRAVASKRQPATENRTID